MTDSTAGQKTGEGAFEIGQGLDEWFGDVEVERLVDDPGTREAIDESGKARSIDDPDVDIEDRTAADVFTQLRDDEGGCDVDSVLDDETPEEIVASADEPEPDPHHDPDGLLTNERELEALLLTDRTSGEEFVWVDTSEMAEEPDPVSWRTDGEDKQSGDVNDRTDGDDERTADMDDRIDTQGAGADTRTGESVEESVEKLAELRVSADEVARPETDEEDAKSDDSGVEQPRPDDGDTSDRESAEPMALPMGPSPRADVTVPTEETDAETLASSSDGDSSEIDSDAPRFDSDASGDDSDTDAVSSRADVGSVRDLALEEEKEGEEEDDRSGVVAWLRALLRL